MEVFRSFRFAVVRWSLVVTAVVAALGGYLFSLDAAQGVLVGGTAAVLGFWIFARKVEQLASLPANEVQFYILKWSFVRYLLFGAAIYRGWSLDPDSLHGLLGAVIGIFVIRFVTIFLGVTGRDLKTRKGASPNREGSEPVADQELDKRSN